MTQIKKWSGWRDSNSRPSPWQGDALPLSHIRINYIYEIFGGGEWIWTTESEANGFTVRPLWPTWVLLHIFWSWWEDLNPQPTDYKSVALPIELHQQAFYFNIFNILFNPLLIELRSIPIGLLLTNSSNLKRRVIWPTTKSKISVRSRSYTSKPY